MQLRNLLWLHFSTLERFHTKINQSLGNYLIVTLVLYSVSLFYFNFEFSNLIDHQVLVFLCTRQRLEVEILVSNTDLNRHVVRLPFIRDLISYLFELGGQKFLDCFHSKGKDHSSNQVLL